MRHRTIAWLTLGFALAAAGLAISLTRSGAIPDERCMTLETCLRDLRAMAHAPGIDDGSLGLESAFVKHVARMEGALPALMPLLADPDRKVAQMAAKAIDAYPKPIDPMYLPQVRAGLDRKLRWLPAVLGNIPSSEAAREAVARFLVSEDAPHNQEAFAVVRSGARAIPFIVDAVRCEHGCGRYDMVHLASVLGEMGPERGAAAPRLLAIAQDATASESTNKNALILMAALGRDAASTEAAVVALRKQRPMLAFDIDNALIAMHSARAGAIFAERLGENPDTVIFSEIAEVGLAARAAGPSILPFLSHADPDVRLDAARVLGFIDYGPAIDPLTALLDDPVDVRVAWAAAESLGRLRASRAIPALERTARTHWYPPVRDTAARAAASLRKSTAFVGKDEAERSRHFPALFLAYDTLGETVPRCSAPAIQAREEPRSRKLHGERDRAALSKLAYPASLSSEGVAPPPPPPDPELTTQYADLMAEREHALRTAPPIVPSVALRVDDGWLVGHDRGEFGGELVFVGNDGKMQRVLEENVEDIYHLGSRTIAVTGRAHGFNKGAIYDIKRVGGEWRTAYWRILPGAPRASWFVETGELLIRLHDAGTVLVSENGDMRMAPCRASNTPAPAASAPR